MRRRLALVPPLALAVLLSPAWTGPASANHDSKVTLRTDLSGEAEVPGPGDRNGSGVAIVRVAEGGSICYRLRVSKISRPTAAHIHQAPAGVAGPVVVPLTGTWTREEGPRTFRLRGCTTSPQAAAIIADPANFYVNVHNAPFPAGAVRGQLPDAGGEPEAS